MEAQEDERQLKSLTNLLKVDKRLKPGQSLADCISQLIKENEELKQQINDKIVEGSPRTPTQGEGS